MKKLNHIITGIILIVVIAFSVVCYRYVKKVNQTFDYLLKKQALTEKFLLQYFPEEIKEFNQMLKAENAPAK